MSTGVQTYRVEPGQRLSGDVHVPGDKSISHRAVMLGAVADGVTTVHGFLESEDCLATLAALRQLGVGCRRDADGTLEITGRARTGLDSPRQPLDLGNSGTAIRLLTGLLAGQRVTAELTGDASLSRRPMARVTDPLTLMGAGIETHDGMPPVRLSGGTRLTGIEYALPVASAQIKSALLLAGLGAQGRTRVVSPGPSRDHTERMLEAMGVPLAIDNDGLDVALDGPVAPRATDIRVPGDLSSAAFFIVGACLAAEAPIVMPGVGVNPTRTGVLEALRRMGARFELDNERRFGAEPVADIRVYPSALVGTEVTGELVPLAIDELPILFVAAAAARGRTIVSGAAELRVKESDRLRVMTEALKAVGVAAEETDDGVVIDGGRIRGGTVESDGDHRVAMALTMAGLVSEAPITIRDTAPVATSFPGFVVAADRANLAISVAEA